MERADIKPDIEVANDYESVAKGEDKQLEKAVEFLLQPLTASPMENIPLQLLPPLPTSNDERTMAMLAHLAAFAGHACFRLPTSSRR